MTSATELERFVERQRRQRVASGLGETIDDPDLLAVIAALVASPTSDDPNAK